MGCQGHNRRLMLRLSRLRFTEIARVASIERTGDYESTMAKPKRKDEEGIEVIVRKERAFHEYEIFDRIECGLKLVGTEVKSLRDGYVTLDESYAKIDGSEVWLIDSEIPEYTMGNRLNHKPKRPRKLLLHKSEIEKFAGKASQRVYTRAAASVL